MADIIRTFGNYINKTALKKPQATQSLLLFAYRLNALSVRLGGEKRLSKARRFAVNHINDVAVSTFAHPENFALTSVFMPCELLHSAGFVPMCAEMYSSYMNGTMCEQVFAEEAEAEGISESYCSFHKIMLGSAFSGVMPRPSVIVNCSTACDANNLTFRAAAAHYDAPHFYVEVPRGDSESDIKYVADQMRELKSFIEEKTGRVITDDALRVSMERTQRSIEALRDCLNEKISHSQPNSVTSELNEIYMAHNALGSEAGERYARELLSELKNSPLRHGKRIIWLQTLPIWQTPVRGLLNFNSGVQVITSDMNVSGLVDIDVDRPYESMARRLILNSFNLSGEKRIEASVRLAKLLDADGVVCFCHWGCKQMMGLSALYKTRLEEAGFPTLILNGDGCDRRNASDGQVATRLNAFMEMLDAQ